MGSTMTLNFPLHRVDDTNSPSGFIILSVEIGLNLCSLRFKRGCVKSFCSRVQSDLKEGSNVFIQLEICLTFLGQKNLCCVGNECGGFIAVSTNQKFKLCNVACVGTGYWTVKTKDM